MKAGLKVCALLAISILSTALANAQTGRDATQHFEKAGVAFDFPAEWKATDRSDDNVKYITVAPKDGGVQISVISQLATEQQCDFQAAGKKITDALVERAASQIGAAPQPSPVKTQVGGLEVGGLQLQGLLNGAPITTEIYSLRVGLRFLNLVYLRVDGDVRGQAAWESIRNTVKVSPVVIHGSNAVSPGEKQSASVLNGRALHLGRPEYPANAKQAQATGLVVVQVTIDEAGRVIAAQAMAGHPLLRGSAEAAARKSEFSPTKLCGEPVRVSGYVTYNFVMR